MSIKMTLPEEVSNIINLLNKNGYEAYAVGGCVRDSVLGKEPHDYDICTSATPEQMKDVFYKKYKTYDTGLQHGTITVSADSINLYEITTFRIDGEYTDGRRPDSVNFVTDVTKDLARRDFTVNAMAYHPTIGLVDPFGGLNDCTNKTIRCVGDPNKRFNEDGLRIMRAVRFAATYGFEIHEDTKRAIHNNTHLLDNISAERKTAEMIKTLTSAKADLLREYSDVLATIIPELKPMFSLDQKTPWHKHDVWEHTIRAVENAPSIPVLKMTMLLHDIGKPHTMSLDGFGKGHFYFHPEKSASMAEDIMKRMRFDSRSIEDVKILTLHHDDNLTHHMTPTNIKLMLNKLRPWHLKQLVEVQRADKQASRGLRHELEALDGAEMTYEDAVVLGQLKALDKYETLIDRVVESKEPYLTKHLAINGNDLKDIGFKGKEIGETLNNLLMDVIEHPEHNKQDFLLRTASQHWDHLNEDIDVLNHEINDRRD